MSTVDVLFYLLSAFAIVSAIMVLISKNPIHSVLWLILVFFAISGHYILLNAQFLAIVNIIVYAGAIMVLFLFVVMLMNLNSDTEPQKSMVVQVSAVLSGGILLTVIIAAFKTYSIQLTTGHALNGQTDIGLIKNLGVILFKEYALPFEISSVLFLSAMIGAVVIGKKDKVGMSLEEFDKQNVN